MFADCTWNCAGNAVPRLILFLCVRSLCRFSGQQIDIFLSFFFFFPRKKALTFYANCLIGDNLPEMSYPVSRKKKKKKQEEKYFKISTPAILHSMLGIKLQLICFHLYLYRK